MSSTARGELATTTTKLLSTVGWRLAERLISLGDPLADRPNNSDIQKIKKNDCNVSKYINIMLLFARWANLFLQAPHKILNALIILLPI